MNDKSLPSSSSTPQNNNNNNNRNNNNNNSNNNEQNNNNNNNHNVNEEEEDEEKQLERAIMLSLKEWEKNEEGRKEKEKNEGIEEECQKNKKDSNFTPVCTQQPPPMLRDETDTVIPDEMLSFLPNESENQKLDADLQKAIQLSLQSAKDEGEGGGYSGMCAAAREIKYEEIKMDIKDLQKYPKKKTFSELLVNEKTSKKNKNDTFKTPYEWQILKTNFPFCISQLYFSSSPSSGSKNDEKNSHTCFLQEEKKEKEKEKGGELKRHKSALKGEGGDLKREGGEEEKEKEKEKEKNKKSNINEEEEELEKGGGGDIQEEKEEEEEEIEKIEEEEKKKIIESLKEQMFCMEKNVQILCEEEEKKLMFLLFGEKPVMQPDDIYRWFSHGFYINGESSSKKKNVDKLLPSPSSPSSSSSSSSFSPPPPPPPPPPFSSSRIAWGLQQHRGGPCGILAALQAFMLRTLLFDFHFIKNYTNFFNFFHYHDEEEEEKEKEEKEEEKEKEKDEIYKKKYYYCSNDNTEGDICKYNIMSSLSTSSSPPSPSSPSSFFPTFSLCSKQFSIEQCEDVHNYILRKQKEEEEKEKKEEKDIKEEKEKRKKQKLNTQKTLIDNTKSRKKYNNNNNNNYCTRMSTYPFWIDERITYFVLVEAIAAILYQATPSSKYLVANVLTHNLPLSHDNQEGSPCSSSAYSSSMQLSLQSVLWPSTSSSSSSSSSSSPPPSPSSSSSSSSSSSIKITILIYVMSSIENVMKFYSTHISDLITSPTAVISFVASVILTRGIDSIKNDMDDESTSLVGMFGHCSQELVNLMLTGSGTSNVFDGTKCLTEEANMSAQNVHFSSYEENAEGNENDMQNALIQRNHSIPFNLTLNGITKRSAIGYLTELEAYRYCEVGSNYKYPVYPIWVLGSSSHYMTLFALDVRINNTQDNHIKYRIEAERAFRQLDVMDNKYIFLEQFIDLLVICDLQDYREDALKEIDTGGGVVLFNDFLRWFTNIQRTLNPEDNVEPPRRMVLYLYDGQDPPGPILRNYYVLLGDKGENGEVSEIAISRPPPPSSSSSSSSSPPELQAAKIDDETLEELREIKKILSTRWNIMYIQKLSNFSE